MKNITQMIYYKTNNSPKVTYF